MYIIDGTIRIAGTGTDVSGKSTALAALAQEAEFRDRVALVPEAASILIGILGCRPPFEGERATHFQRAVAGKTRLLEDLTARRNPRRVLLCDRGLPDHAAYLGGQEAFEREIGMPLADAWRRYTVVLYFQAPPRDVFKEAKALNPGRVKRTYEETLALDRMTYEAWTGCRHIELIPSCEHWEDKLDHAREALRRHIRRAFTR